MSRLWRAATLVWIGLILVGSLLPPSLGAPGGPGWHTIGFGVLGALLGQGFGPWPAWALGAGYGAVIEGIQGLVRYRSAEPGDLLVNALAVAAGVIASRIWARRRGLPR